MLLLLSLLLLLLQLNVNQHENAVSYFVNVFWWKSCTNVIALIFLSLVHALFCAANQSHNWFMSKFTSLSWMRLCFDKNFRASTQKPLFYPKQIRTLFLSFGCFFSHSFAAHSLRSRKNKSIGWLSKYLEKCSGWNLYTVTNVYGFNRKSRLLYACWLCVCVLANFQFVARQFASK